MHETSEEGVRVGQPQDARVATLDFGLLQKSMAQPSRAARLLAGLRREWAAQSAQAFHFLPVGLGLGIWLWFALPFVAQRQAALLAALALALLAAPLPGGARRWLVIGSLLVAAGMLAAEVRSLAVAAPILYHRLTPAPVEGRIESIAPLTAGARVMLLRDDGLRLAIRLPPPVATGLVAGARIRVTAAFEPQQAPLVPGGFDAARRAWFEGVSARGRATGPPELVAPAPPRPGPAEALARLRQGIDRQLLQALGPRHGAIAAALVTGSKSSLPPDLVESVRIAGLAHLLTVSGFHIGALAAGIFLLARRLPLLVAPGIAAARSIRPFAAVAAIIAGLAYVVVSGAEVPAIRAGITVTLVLGAMAAGRDPFSLRLLAFAAALILLFRPESLLSPSFQLSFAAVAGLVLLAESALFRRWLAPGQGGRLDAAARWAGALILSSLVAELVLAPIAAAHFGRMGVYGVLANTLAIPLTSFVLMPLLLLQLFFGALGFPDLVAPLLGKGLSLFESIATRVAAIPGASLAIPSGPPLAHLLAVAGGLLLALLTGPLRLVGMPLLLAALALHLLWPRPDLLLSPDGRQVGIVDRRGALFLARGRGESFLARSWKEATGARAVAPLADHPGARCGPASCLVRIDGRRPFRLFLLKTEDPVPANALAAACNAADLAVGPRLDLGYCRPRWLALDRAAMARLGSVAIHAPSRRIIASAASSGDHPWSPSALPGVQKRLLGGEGWVEPMVE